MFRNLEAEQKRYNLTNEQTADLLGISRITYEKKKKSGSFSWPQIMALLKLFNSKFDYLFATDSDGAKSA